MYWEGFAAIEPVLAKSSLCADVMCSLRDMIVHPPEKINLDLLKGDFQEILEWAHNEYLEKDKGSFSTGLWLEVAKVAEFGAKKYAIGGYLQGMSLKVIFESMARHILKYYGGQTFDDESSLDHLAHVCANALIAIELININNLTFELAPKDGEDDDIINES